MTYQEANIAIAEAHGWRPHPDNATREPTNRFWTFGGAKYGEFKDGNAVMATMQGDPEAGVHALPDYFEDANAMHSALMTLSEDERRMYYSHLAAGVCSNPVEALFASAAQQAEAFIRTKKLRKSR